MKKGRCKKCEYYYAAPTPEEIVPWCEKYDKKILHASRWCKKGLKNETILKDSQDTKRGV